ncbi:SDR family NAD(P)-dependent oxidoreductase [Enterococcus ureasiticus]|uniref:oxidoreductase n=1 Tax=Enterococcus ureasiticus TaxID=903984 RepID=UPI001A9046A0|nr:oxidoreductase [Enterococcus ureasiticus]MBO0472627.1 SDR family NAD(P)-dependent oxidoreductase [Enterococcus ureasiticus]
MANNEKVWFLTGASTGFGKALTLKLLEHHYRVVATARNPQGVESYLTNETDVLIIPLDVTKKEQVKQAVSRAIEYFGQIDVLVNNAGIGYFSSIEEADEQETRNLFDINFFGLASVTSEVLPLMRKANTGHILNISSVGGLVAFPGFGYYHASKFALEGYSESLYQEVMPLGIHVTLIEPGDFTTDFAGRSAKENTTTISDYNQSAGKSIRGLRQLSEHQPGNPELAAEAMIKITESSMEPPLRLLLGSDAYKHATKKIDASKTSIETWKQLTLTTDH